MKLSAVILAFLSVAANAADWSDASISYSHGWRYNTPGIQEDYQKDILTLEYVSANKLGSNYFNIDMLRSQASADPAHDSTSDSQEAYVVYRNNLSLSKLTGKSMSLGIVRDVSLHSGIDFSANNNNFGAAERKWMIGPQVEFDVPGYFALAAVALKDIGNNSFAGKEFNGDLTWRLASSWNLKTTVLGPAVFKGWATLTGSRGTDPLGVKADATEVWFQAWWMWDVGSFAGKPGTWYVGPGYEYIRNKYNYTKEDYPGTRTYSPQIRLEAHF